VGIATEMLLRMSKEGRARVLKEAILNPNSTRLIAQIQNPATHRGWARSALATLMFRGGGIAAEGNEEP
jgi:hypothetical protein